MSKTSLASKFAGLMSGSAFLAGKKTGKAADGEDTEAEKPTKGDDESDEEFEKRLKEWEDAQDDGEEAEGTPKDTSDDDQDKEEKLKSAKAAGVAEGVLAERARWTAVLSSPAASGRVIAACTFLESTDLAPEAINKALSAMPEERAARSTTRERMAQEAIPVPAVGGSTAEADPDPAKAFAARVTASAEKARGKAKAA